jgi:hypothetical protein
VPRLISPEFGNSLFRCSTLWRNHTNALRSRTPSHQTSHDTLDAEARGIWVSAQASGSELGYLFWKRNKVKTQIFPLGDCCSSFGGRRISSAAMRMRAATWDWWERAMYRVMQEAIDMSTNMTFRF